MRERPILLNAEMVRAVLNGRKTQTRRVIQSLAKSMQANGQKVIDYREPGDKWYGDHVFSMRNQSGTWCDYTKEQFLAKCPFGAVGDRLWVRETWARYNIDQDTHDIAYRATTPEDWPKEGRWRPSIHMPRWASRLTLEITGVRVERLNSVNEHDAIAEGLAEISKDGQTYKYGVPDRDGYPGTDDFGWPWHEWERYPISAYSKLWKSIYGEESWQANPWVWVIEFKRVEVNG
ncbi:hypothetical protein [Pantoea ananatis]|uniref:hypothetical protein n=1 Tax=Pantoea ananas TaxID=553 RepID=UPI000CF40884|nr:hypothetical protein [Pantoea ananatis]PQK86787.1 hypothetical protein CG431_06555 [Pantoea ananatis]